ncbi:AmmeMemoRadiSam system protein A [bacterium]|nr:AmmeMemoRadiSam system protein A [bacterium]
MQACETLDAGKVKVLKHANSGDTSYGDKDQVVGYLAAAFYRDKDAGETSKKATKEEKPTLSRGDAEPLSLEDKRTLMKIAKETVAKVVNGEEAPHFEVTSADLLENRGAFVTLHEHGQLRGCIGFIVGVKPLWETVREVAESAALKDPRFPPVSPNELDDLEYEISALSPIRPITDVSEIEVGVHGIIMRRGYHQGLLLPQVATEQGWDRETFLQHTCMKAGLPVNAWKDPDAEIQIFSAEVFDEGDIE